MSEWKLHIPTEGNGITHYKCGLVAGQRVRLKKDIVVTCDRSSHRPIHHRGEEGMVIEGITTDPVLWFRRPDGERHTWDNDAASVDEWFERIDS
jgi:hypothetical protein